MGKYSRLFEKGLHGSLSDGGGVRGGDKRTGGGEKVPLRFLGERGAKGEV